jgi:hypothetical protein
MSRELFAEDFSRRLKLCTTVVAAMLMLAGFATVSSSQQPMAEKAAGTPTATVTFTLDFPHSDPEHYSIAVESSGHTRYESTADEQTYNFEFELSPGNREKIFEWAKQARYFAGNIDSGNRKLAFTGTKILSYRDGQRENTARYDYSNLAPVRELTSLFQGMAATLEYGRHITYYHRYQKLALDDELKRMEAQARSNDLSEIQAVAPILREIVDDSSVMNVVRARANELMQIGSGSAVAAGGNQR